MLSATETKIPTPPPAPLGRADSSASGSGWFELGTDARHRNVGCTILHGSRPSNDSVCGVDSEDAALFLSPGPGQKPFQKGGKRLWNATQFLFDEEVKAIKEEARARRRMDK